MEKILDRFLRYVAVDTQSNEESESQPSTAKQLNLLRMLCAELNAMGVEATLDEFGYVEFGYVMGSIPSNVEAKVPAIGFIAHVDTAPDASGADIKPQIVENYDGGEIALKGVPGLALKPSEFPEMLHYVGQTLVTTDGTTLLGADDKGGVAEIMDAVQYIVSHPEFKHGPIKIGFTPDEEIGVHDGRRRDRRTGVRELQRRIGQDPHPGPERAPGLREGQDEERPSHRPGALRPAARGPAPGIHGGVRGILPPDRLQRLGGGGGHRLHYPRPRPREVRGEEEAHSGLCRFHQYEVRGRHRRAEPARPVLQHARAGGTALFRGGKGREGDGNGRGTGEDPTYPRRHRRREPLLQGPPLPEHLRRWIEFPRQNGVRPAGEHGGGGEGHLEHCDAVRGVGSRIHGQERAPFQRPFSVGTRCSCLVCTSKSLPMRAFVYISPDIQPFSPSFEETCTTKRHCGAVLLYKRALYMRPAFSLSEIFLIFAVRSAPSRTGHRPGGEMVDTRDLKSLGPKRPCGFDSRPGHRRDFVS